MKWLALFMLGAMATGGPSHAGEPLASWNDGAAKTAIVDFVAKVTQAGGAEFLDSDERVAVFDNDGTLWAEQPYYVQLAFAVDRVKALAPQHPEWKDQEPFASVLRGDLKSALAGGEKAAAEIVGATHAGMTTDEFSALVKAWARTAKNARTGRLHGSMVYQPMLELIAYLKANGFTVYIVTGGGAEFVRAVSEDLYGIAPEHVVGSRGQLKFEMHDGRTELRKLPQIDLVNDGPGKPVGISQQIGRRPVAAFGNSDGDLQMLQYSCVRPGPSLCLYVHHTDAAREFAYDRQSSIGKLDKGLDEAKARGWTVADMRTDWKIIYPPVGADSQPGR